MLFSQQVTLKNGKPILLRSPQPADVELLLSFVNKISREDTYITLSGETLTYNEEEHYLVQSCFEIEQGNRVQLFAFDGDLLAANADIHRITRFRKRSLHVGEVAISVLQEYRGLGLGRFLLETLITQAKNNNFRLLVLSAFSENTRAVTLYQKLGFKVAGEIPGAIWYKDRYIGEVHMYKEL